MDGSAFHIENDTVARRGWHFLQLPGPTNIPGRVLNAMNRPAIDQRGQEFAELSLGIFRDLKSVFKTREEVFIFPSSGTGAGEAAIANTLSAGDQILTFDSGQFSWFWIDMAKKFGLHPVVMETDWRRAPVPADIEARLRLDTDHEIKAILVVHNETSTGTTARIPEIRDAIDAAGHPALLMVDTISSLGSIDFRMDDWGVDVAIAGSQKGLMLPPGLSFNVVSEKAREASKTSTLPCFYFDWEWMRSMNASGFFPYTPAIQLLYGLRESLDMLAEEGLPKTFQRHAALGEATRAAAVTWGLELVCQEPTEYSDSVTAIFLPDGHDADAFRQHVLDNYNIALGGGLARLAGRVFRIGHMGDINGVMLTGVLSAIESALETLKIPHRPGGAEVARLTLRQPA